MKTRTFDAHISACHILESIDKTGSLKQKYKDILKNRMQKKEYPTTRNTIKNILFFVLEKHYIGLTIPVVHRNKQKNWQTGICQKIEKIKEQK